MSGRPEHRHSRSKATSWRPATRHFICQLAASVVREGYPRTGWRNSRFGFPTIRSRETGKRADRGGSTPQSLLI